VKKKRKLEGKYNVKNKTKIRYLKLEGKIKID
jgi:hypothetical protein